MKIQFPRPIKNTSIYFISSKSSKLLGSRSTSSTPPPKTFLLSSELNQIYKFLYFLLFQFFSFLFFPIFENLEFSTSFKFARFPQFFSPKVPRNFHPYSAYSKSPNFLKLPNLSRVSKPSKVLPNSHRM